MGHGLFQKKCQVNEGITSSRPNSSQKPHQLYICNTVDQLCRIIAAKKNTLLDSKMLYIHFININMLIVVDYLFFLKYTRYLISFIRSCFSSSKAAVLLFPWVNKSFIHPVKCHDPVNMKHFLHRNFNKNSHQVLLQWSLYHIFFIWSNRQNSWFLLNATNDEIRVRNQPKEKQSSYLYSTKPSFHVCLASSPKIVCQYFVHLASRV